jgi:hypothetical protein
VKSLRERNIGVRVGVGALAVLVATVASVLVFDGKAPAASTFFVGDYETGDFGQWPICQDFVVGSAPCAESTLGDHSMRVQQDVVRQGRFAARFELRPGERASGQCCGHRAEVSGDDATAAVEGDERWYQWSFQPDAQFPAAQGWTVLGQWHADLDGSPPVAINAGPTNVGPDRWGVVVSTWDAPGRPGPTFTPWSAPVARGTWTDLKLHVKWSARDDVGFIELWVDGAPQTFTAEPCRRQTRCMVRTLMPGGGGIYYKQGYYRDPAITDAGVVYHDGFSAAATESALQPL